MSSNAPSWCGEGLIYLFFYIPTSSHKGGSGVRNFEFYAITSV